MAGGCGNRIYTDCYEWDILYTFSNEEKRGFGDEGKVSANKVYEIIDQALPGSSDTVNIRKGMEGNSIEALMKKEVTLERVKGGTLLILRIEDKDE